MKGWLTKAKNIRGPTPLPEVPRSEQLEKLLVVVPYKAPAKKGKKKEVPEAREGLRYKVRWGEEESASSHSKKRVAAEDVEEVQPCSATKRQCRPKLILSDSSDSDKESEVSEKVPKKEPRVKPLASRTDCLLTFYLDDLAAAAAEVEGLREALKEVEAEAAEKKTTAKKAVEFQDAAEKLEALEKGREEQSSHLSKAEKELQEARTGARGVREELQQAAQIANGVFAELSKNAAAAARHYATLEEDSTQRLFWS
nr:axoneme-associated protein mst101(1)-like [Aegilops tauschii subsp. strangulata]